MNSIGLLICLCSKSYKMNGFLIILNCLEVVFQNYYYCECFYLVNFDFFSCTDKMICLVPCTFMVYSGFLVFFVCIH